MSKKNLFGGGNPNSAYVPISDVEMEVIERLRDAGDLVVHVIGWGVVNKPRVIFGDLRLGLAFRLNFDRPDVPIPVSYFDLELRTSSGLLLFKERQSTMYAGKPIQVASGVFLDVVWDIALLAIDPDVVRQIKPGTIGLTSRLQDRDTGDFTLTGNMKLTTHQRTLLHQMRQRETGARAVVKRKAKKASEG